MIFNQGNILKMIAEDFDEIKFKWLKVITNKDYEIAGVKGKEFVGYITGLYLAANHPHLPTHINFVSEKSTSAIRNNISPSLIDNIMVFDIENIELK